MKKIIFFVLCTAVFMVLCYVAGADAGESCLESFDPDEPALTMLYAGVCVAIMVLGPCFRPAAMMVAVFIGGAISILTFGIDAFIAFVLSTAIVSATVRFEPEIRKMVSCLWTDDEE